MSYHFLCKRGIRPARTEQFLFMPGSRWAGGITSVNYNCCFQVSPNYIMPVSYEIRTAWKNTHSISYEIVLPSTDFIYKIVIPRYRFHMKKLLPQYIFHIKRWLPLYYLISLDYAYILMRHGKMCCWLVLSFWCVWHKWFLGWRLGVHISYGVWFGLVYGGLTPQQQPGSYQGGEMMIKSVFWWRKPEYPEETTDLRQVTDETSYGEYIFHDKIYPGGVDISREYIFHQTPANIIWAVNQHRTGLISVGYLAGVAMSFFPLLNDGIIM